MIPKGLCLREFVFDMIVNIYIYVGVYSKLVVGVSLLIWLVWLLPVNIYLKCVLTYNRVWSSSDDLKRLTGR